MVSQAKRIFHGAEKHASLNHVQRKLKQERSLQPYRYMVSPCSLRLALVDYARQCGIKAAARAFQTTVRTVHKWLRRYQAQGPRGLQELSRAPRSCCQKTSGGTGAPSWHGLQGSQSRCILPPPCRHPLGQVCAIAAYLAG